MKHLPLLLIVVLLFVSGLLAQKRPGAAPSDEFRLGPRTVKIPAPDGFTDVFTRLDKIAARMIAIEDAESEILSLHLPGSDFTKYEADQDQDLDIYTKVSIPKRLKTMDISPSMFADLAAATEKQIVTFFDPSSPIFKRAEQNAGKGLSELWANETTVKINEPKHLGYFEKGTDVLSFMSFMNFDVNNRKFSILNASSFVLVNDRVLFIYTFKKDPVAGDIEKLRSFATKWTAKIREANNKQIRK